MELDIGAVKLKGPTTTGNVTAHRPGKKGEEADATIYHVMGPEVKLTLHNIVFDDGARQVITEKTHYSPARFNRLIRRLRFTTLDNNNGIFVLRQARMKDDVWSNLFTATRQQLDVGAGMDVEKALLDAGASAYGTRAEVLGETGRTRNQMCVTFRDDEGDLVPLVAYVATRVLPVLRGFSA